MDPNATPAAPGLATGQKQMLPPQPPQQPQRPPKPCRESSGPRVILFRAGSSDSLLQDPSAEAGVVVFNPNAFNSTSTILASSPQLDPWRADITMPLTREAEDEIPISTLQHVPRPKGIHERNEYASAYGHHPTVRFGQQYIHRNSVQIQSTAATSNRLLVHVGCVRLFLSIKLNARSSQARLTRRLAPEHSPPTLASQYQIPAAAPADATNDGERLVRTAGVTGASATISQLHRSDSVEQERPSGTAGTCVRGHAVNK
ncbi:hypothetical protein BC828DRAFT_401540 [Blastocladiella britannica]|nr:hypothetical protein BC828DRAFT_401540 [Blastocladiella britannica]